MGEVDEAQPLIDYGEEELTGCGGSLPCNPRRPLHRYLVLIIMCFLSFGKCVFCLEVHCEVHCVHFRDFLSDTVFFTTIYVFLH